MKIFPKIRTPIRKILADLKTEDEVKFLIVYKKFAGQTKVNNLPETSYTDFPITAIRLRHSENTAKALGKSESNIQQGDIIYLIDARDFPSSYSLKDKVDNGTRVETIKDITPVFDLLFVVTVESS